MLEDNSRNNLHSLQSAVYVPFLQSAASGLFIAVAVCGVAVLLHWRISVALLAAAGLGASVCWVFLLWHWLKLTTPTPPVQLVEDWQETPQAETYPVIRVEVKRENTLTFIDLPVSDTQLSRLAAGVLDGAPLAESQWCGRGRPFSRGQFAQLRQELLTRGLAVWRNDAAPAQGVELTAAGRAVLKQCLTTPLLLEDRTQE